MKDSIKEKEILKSKDKVPENFEINIEENTDPKVKSPNTTNENEEVVTLNAKDEIELTDEVKNARKKRRRSSASIE